MDACLPPPPEPGPLPRRTNVVLIDLENVQPAGLQRLSDDHFRIVVFVGPLQKAIPIEMVTALQPFGPRAEYVRVSTQGQNALDLHLAFHAGRLAAAHPRLFFHIIAKDRGYESLIRHLEEIGIPARRSESVDELPIVKQANLRTPEDRAEHFMQKLRLPKATRPRKEATLASSIRAVLGGGLSDEEVREVVARLKAVGFLEVRDGKVAYLEALADSPALPASAGKSVPARPPAAPLAATAAGDADRLGAAVLV